MGIFSGVHCIEFLCPDRCEGIIVGIVKEGWKSVDEILVGKHEIFEFKFALGRNISLKINMELQEVRCWVNGFYDKTKFRKIE